MNGDEAAMLGGMLTVLAPKDAAAPLNPAAAAFDSLSSCGARALLNQRMAENIPATAAEMPVKISTPKETAAEGKDAIQGAARPATPMMGQTGP